MGAAQRGTEWCSGHGTPTAMQGEQNVVGVLPTLRAGSQEHYSRAVNPHLSAIAVSLLLMWPSCFSLSALEACCGVVHRLVVHRLVVHRLVVQCSLMAGSCPSPHVPCSHTEPCAVPPCCTSQSGRSCRCWEKWEFGLCWAGGPYSLTLLLERTTVTCGSVAVSTQ